MVEAGSPAVGAQLGLADFVVSQEQRVDGRSGRVGGASALD
ncbi:hypothetical protein [Kitasatospora sp. NPDC059571]